MAGDQWTDDEIIKAIKAAGILREKALYHIYFHLNWKGAVIGYVLKNGGNEQDGEDLGSMALANFEQNIRGGKFNSGSALKTYFLSIARFQWLKELRRRRPIEEFKPEQYEEVGDNVEYQYIKVEEKQYFDKAWGHLSERCKKILMLQQLGHSLTEVAQMVGISSAAMAKKEASRCRMRFRKFLEENPGWKDLIM